MPDFTILYDEPHEAAWFRNLHADLLDAAEESITVAQKWPAVQRVLSYDRPDIVLLDDGVPILVIEETVEVPSGHNVGQRFARIAAAAECRVPSLYFGPYVAKKHGGRTAGPRYMNLRLFHAIDAMVRVTGTAITSINCPVDADFEVRRDAAKDKGVRAYVEMFLAEYRTRGSLSINAAILASDVHLRMLEARREFVANAITDPGQYDAPPKSVEILPLTELQVRHPGVLSSYLAPEHREAVLYNVGMTGIRSDPYTGMAMLYRYLYIAEQPSRALVLWFPRIAVSDWRAAARRASRKDVRLFRIAADAIIFANAVLSRRDL